MARKSRPHSACALSTRWRFQATCFRGRGRFFLRLFILAPLADCVVCSVVGAHLSRCLFVHGACHTLYNFIVSQSLAFSRPGRACASTSLVVIGSPPLGVFKLPHAAPDSPRVHAHCQPDPSESPSAPSWPLWHHDGYIRPRPSRPSREYRPMLSRFRPR